jgi:hypothetical protein
VYDSLVKFSLSVLCRLVLTYSTVAPVLIDAQGNQTNRSPLSSCSYSTVAPVDLLTTSFKDTNRFCFTAPNHGSYPIPFTQRLTSFHRRCARCIRCGQHIRPNDPNKPEGEWNYPPTDTVLETAGLRPIEEKHRRRRDTALCFASERYAIYRQCLHPSFSFFPFSLYRYAWYPLSSLQ